MRILSAIQSVKEKIKIYKDYNPAMRRALTFVNVTG